MKKKQTSHQSVNKSDAQKTRTTTRPVNENKSLKTKMMPQSVGKTDTYETMAWFTKYESTQREVMLKRARYLDTKMKKPLQCECGTEQPVDTISLPTLLVYIRIWTTAWLDAAKHALRRPLYYAQETARRRILAKERRSTRQRHTENPCPTTNQILDAWQKKTESREAMLRFGSLIEDLACHVDSSLHIVNGRIVGRAPGVKGWLHDNLPVLAACYSTVMRYRAAARRLRQIVDLKDPIPVETLFTKPDEATPSTTATTINTPDNIVPATDAKTSADDTQPNRDPATDAKTSADDTQHNDDPTTDETHQRNEMVTRNETIQQGPVQTRDEMNLQNETATHKVTARPPRMVEIARAQAVFHEAMANVPDRVTPTLRRIHELLDPERVADATMLKSWRDHYARTITEATWKTTLKHTIADGIKVIERLTS